MILNEVSFDNCLCDISCDEAVKIAAKFFQENSLY